MNLEEISNRIERGTVLITLYVKRESSVSSVLKKMKKECCAARNIKEKKRRKQVTKTIKMILKRLGEIPCVGKGFIIFGAYDGV